MSTNIKTEFIKIKRFNFKSSHKVFTVLAKVISWRCELMNISEICCLRHLEINPKTWFPENMKYVERCSNLCPVYLYLGTCFKKLRKSLLSENGEVNDVCLYIICLFNIEQHWRRVWSWVLDEKYLFHGV